MSNFSALEVAGPDIARHTSSGKKSGNLRKVLEIRGMSGNFIMLTCPKEK